MFSPDTNILIVDDMSSIRDLIKKTLKALGYKKIEEAQDGVEGFQKLVQKKDTPEKFTLIISDWNMPNKNGLEFLREVRAHQEFKNIPFILLTSESERDQVTEAILAGVSQYIVKPFSPKVLIDKLKSTYAKHY
jgi:two-component system chemotaxis response regulator CheY